MRDISRIAGVVTPRVLTAELTEVGTPPYARLYDYEPMLLAGSGYRSM